MPGSSSSGCPANPCCPPIYDATPCQVKVTLDIGSSCRPSASSSSGSSGGNGSGVSSSSSSSLSSSSSGPSGLSVACCSQAISPQLIATITDGTHCACADTTITLDWNSGTARWEGSGPLGSCGRDITLSLRWDGTSASALKLSYSYSDDCGSGGTDQGPLSSACDPLFLEYWSNPTIDCCNHGEPSHFRIVITE